jgi:hypothetical protein
MESKYHLLIEELKLPWAVVLSSSCKFSLEFSKEAPWSLDFVSFRSCLIRCLFYGVEISLYLTFASEAFSSTGKFYVPVLALNHFVVELINLR